MPARKSPRILAQCIANRYASPGEAIAEVSAAGTKDRPHLGCLVSARVNDRGQLVIEVYRGDPGVILRVNGQDLPVPR